MNIAILWDMEIFTGLTEATKTGWRARICHSHDLPLCHPLGVAVLAARADLRAARHRVPRRVRPFDV